MQLVATSNNIDQLIRETLAGYPDILLGVLFGSMAKGTANPDSDLDLAVYAQRPITVENKMQLIGALAERIGRPVDLVDLSTAGLPVTGQILQKGRRIFGSKSLFASLVTRYQVDSADFMPIRQRVLKERRCRWIGF